MSGNGLSANDSLAARVEAAAVNDMLIQHLASKLPEPEQRNVLAWACRLREQRRMASLALLLESLLAAAASGQPVGEPFASAASSDGELPTIRELSSVDRAGDRQDVSRGPPGPPGPPDMGWARALVRAHRPAPDLFLGLQPKPRTGAMCYMSVFGS